MDQDRLVGISLGRLNRGLLIFRLGLYAAVAFGLLQRATTLSSWLAIIVVAAAFLPAIPNLRWKIEIGVASTLLLEFLLTLAVGTFLALQIVAMFSLAVAGLLLARKVATMAVGMALLLQVGTILLSVLGLIPGEATLADLLGETILLLAVGIGYSEIGKVLRAYQSRQVEQAREELRLTEMIESMDRLIDSIAHEIRTPVTAVLGLSSELAVNNDLGAEEAAEVAGLVVTESRRLAHLVDNMVMRSRADINRLGVDTGPVQIGETLNSTWQSLGLDPGSLTVVGDAEVLADRGRLRQILVNLFDNSLRHGALPVTVEVSNGAMVRSRFTDAGPGFDPTISSRVFERYKGTKDDHRPDNVGLGLPISRMLAHRMNGELDIEGKTVILELPAANTWRA